MLLALTIWRESLVMGLKAVTTSTIWNRACRLLMMPFCPVSITIGIAFVGLMLALLTIILGVVALYL